MPIPGLAFLSTILFPPPSWTLSRNFVATLTVEPSLSSPFHSFPSIPSPHTHSLSLSVCVCVSGSLSLTKSPRLLFLSSQGLQTPRQRPPKPRIDQVARHIHLSRRRATLRLQRPRQGDCGHGRWNWHAVARLIDCTDHAPAALFDFHLKATDETRRRIRQRRRRRRRRRTRRPERAKRQPSSSSRQARQDHTEDTTQSQQTRHGTDLEFRCPARLTSTSLD
ncbi:hypothetical protein BD289DRAFT_215766 [Coniella lustricola]|uniref:Uncharacterized protein n=1 Tax=Coniella lustricola TaxID=2025994 RepID=A0A2T2ZS29_9PEZI|nr:hypothetical protein BD289DRAFT_215766 [Coniella lustricola]